jgi:DivIVA domain-containing protein
VDRDQIQRRDFPTGRRGYDPAAVDEHLRRVADAFASNTPPPAAPSLAASTSEQVREILEAAERSAAAVRAQASDHVAQFQQATAGMLSQLDQLEGELGRLMEALRTAGERLTQGLQQLQEQVGGAPAPVSPLPDDEAGARLIALNMALSGTPREETAAYLAEHFELADPGALLDDVYARAGQ